jgi:glycerol-3-phosphate cytidylyltransferase-like family protein
MSERRVFTFGDFDLIHVGVVKLLRFAAQEFAASGTEVELTVALRTDEVIDCQRRERLHTFEERLEMLSMMRHVSFVRRLEDELPIQMLIDMYRVANGPHVIVEPTTRLKGRTTDLEIAVGAYGGIVIPYDTTHDKAHYWSLRAFRDRSKTMKKLRRKV